ncbi:MAG: hypothetical protein IJ308_04735 [Clostridia bacterium]|nr:hypothetical protein [Clostridia bacterium]
MEKKTTPSGAKIFKYKLTKGMLAIAIVVLALSVGGAALSVYRFAKSGFNEVTDFITHPLLILASLFCFALAISILAKSQYAVTDKDYIMQFGFIKSTYPIKDITKVVYDTDKKKLTVFVGEEFSVLPLCADWQEEFVQALRTVKPSIDYSFTSSKTED